MEDLSLHILDIVENSITAGADRIEIKIIEDTKANIFSIEIKDNGKGMDKELLENACDPFYTTRTTRRVGLGIPMLAQAAKECMGNINVVSAKGKGTAISVSFQHNHIDRKPLGDMEQTLIILIASNPEIDFIFEHKINNNMYTLDTTEIKNDLDGVPISTPEVIRIIKDDISAWLNSRNNMIE
jgi:anti-sigma regulatory factor (Ser/Thr protein kinase)